MSNIGDRIIENVSVVGEDNRKEKS